MKTLTVLVALTGALLAAAPSLAAPAAAPAITLRAYPAEAVRTYPLESLRGVQSLMLQNLAVINTSAVPETLTRIDIELLSAGQVVDRRTVEGEALARTAKAGAQLQPMAADARLDFLFGDVLGRPRAPLGATPDLRPGEAMLVSQQMFAWKGARDQLRVTAYASKDGREVSASLVLPILPMAAEPRYVFPLEGRWYVAVGPTFHTAHRWAPPEEFAFDIVRIGDGGLTHRGAGTEPGDYYDYGAVVRAAGEGEVVAAVDGRAEDAGWFRKPGEGQDAYLQRLYGLQDTLLSQGPDAAGGNYVMIRHPWGEYSLYAHLQPGSVLVKVGDHVDARQPLAKLGTTGGSTEPHLHFQVCDAPRPLLCAGIPVSFKDLELPMADYPRAVQSGDFVESH